MNKELDLKEIRNFAATVAGTMRKYCKCKANDPITLENIRKSLLHYEEELKEKTEKFLETYPETDKLELNSFIANIKMYEGMIVDAEENIQTYQSRQNEMLDNFLKK